MLTVVSFKWEPTATGYDLPMSIPKYTSEHVRIHKAMLERHSTVPFKYVCITDVEVEHLHSALGHLVGQHDDVAHRVGDLRGP